MNLKIHRGTNEIGGSCVEVWTGKSRLVLDFGLPLVNPDKSPFDARTIQKSTPEDLIGRGILPDIPGLFVPDKSTALLLSHAHMDHYGLMDYIHPDCPVYLGRGSRKIIEISSIFMNRNWSVADPRHFESGKPFSFGDFEITPYLMDHSAFDAYAFMIRASGRSLFYSGDFRVHGRKSRVFDWFVRHVDPPVDCLLLEGTSVGREEKSARSEGEIEAEFVACFRESEGINLIYTSSQNIDRLVSIYRACKRTGKTLAVDFYTAALLEELAGLGVGLPFPSPAYPEIRVFFPYRLSGMVSRKGRTDLLYRFKAFKIRKEEIDARFMDTVMLVRPGMKTDLDRISNLDGGSLIYSMWSGYQADDRTRSFLEYLTGRGMTLREIHTGGHADHAALKRMVDLLRPRLLVPIHTFGADQYERIFRDVKVLRLQDHRAVNLEAEVQK